MNCCGTGGTKKFGMSFGHPSACCGIGVGHGFAHGHGMGFRRFISKKEKIEMLEKYREQLEKELEAVNEHIQKMNKK